MKNNAAEKPTGKKKKKTDDEKHWALHLKRAVKKVVWPKYPFCNSNKRLMECTRLVMNDIAPKEFEELEGKELRRAQGRWMLENCDQVRELMNQVRNYFQGQVRDLIVGKLVKGEEVPTKEEIEMCVMRKKEYLETKEGKEVFEFYWNDILPKVARNHHWSKSDKWEGTISRAKHPSDPSKDYHSNYKITPQLEAMALIYFKNCSIKWANMGAEKKECLRNGEEYKYNGKAANMQVPYTDAKGGQQHWGGWTADGQDVYKEDRDAVMKIRKAKHDYVGLMEDATLQRLHELNNYGQEDGDEGRGANGQPKKKKRKAVDSDVEEEPWNTDDEVEEDEEEDENENKADV